MSDAPNKDGESTETKPQDATPPASTNPADKGDTPDWFDSLDSDSKKELESEAKKKGFKSASDFWKSYREAESKISSQGMSLAEAEKFEKQVAPVINAVWSDPELLKSVQKKLNSNYTSEDSKSEPSNKKSDAKSEPARQSDPETYSVLSNQIAENFEAKVGLSSLDKESIKEVRQIIGKEMAKWAQPGKRIPLKDFGNLLQDAFDLASTRNERLKAILSDKKKPDINASAKMSSDSQFTVDSKGEIQLTTAQTKVAEKMPGGIEAYKKGLKKINS